MDSWGGGRSEEGSNQWDAERVAMAMHRSSCHMSSTDCRVRCDCGSIRRARQQSRRTCRSSADRACPGKVSTFRLPQVVWRPWVSLVIVFVLTGCLSPSAYAFSLGSLKGRKLATGTNITTIDQTIQAAAFAAFTHAKTGTIYNATLPSSLASVTVQAIRLRTGHLRRKGLVFNEFNIPPGCVVEDRSLVRVILVYRNFGNLSIYLSPIAGQGFVSPVVGVLAYDASNLGAIGLAPVNVNATGSPITVRLPLKYATASPRCASFDISGTANVSQLSSPPNTCSSTHFGDFALIGVVPTPAPAPSPVSAPSKKHRSNAWKIALGTVLGVVGLVLILALLTLLGLRFREKQRFSKMQYHADRGENLQSSFVGSSRAPAAGSTRTRPTLETLE